MESFRTLILLYFGFSSSLSPLRTYYYVKSPLNWTDAQSYCREKYTDLATFENMEDLNRLPPPEGTNPCWIGLRDDPKSWRESLGTDTNSWRWSATGEPSKTGYHNWGWNEPSSQPSEENYAAMVRNGQWNDYTAGEAELHPMCFTVENGKKSFVFIWFLKSWTDARDYCREHYTDLAVIESKDENDDALRAKPSNTIAWIGLYRIRWVWSDGSLSPFRLWQEGQPGYLEFCVAHIPKLGWDDWYCHHKLPFFCHKVHVAKTKLKMKFQTDADLTDPAINTQILQQLEAALARQGMTDFKLRWSIPPKKQETSEEDNESQCPSN